MGIRRSSVASKTSLLLLSMTALGVGLAACASSDPATPGHLSVAGAAGTGAAGAPVAGAASTSGGSGGSVTGGGGAAGALGVAGSATVAGAGGTVAGAGAGGASSGSAGAAGGLSVAGATGIAPMCLTNDVAGGVARATNQYIECDVEKQSIEFDAAADITGGKGPAYDPATTPASFTNYGTAFTGSQVQQCHPYCWKGNLTIGIGFKPGSDASTRGEVLLDFPPTVVIADANGRNSLGWIWVDGPDLPAGSTLTAQMVLKSSSKGLLVANDSKKVTLKTWVEFKYFAIQTGFNAADLKDITSIGFRLTLTPNTATAWSGVVYADHFELRQ